MIATCAATLERYVLSRLVSIPILDSALCRTARTQCKVVSGDAAFVLQLNGLELAQVLLPPWVLPVLCWASSVVLVGRHGLCGCRPGAQAVERMRCTTRRNTATVLRAHREVVLVGAAPDDACRLVRIFIRKLRLAPEARMALYGRRVRSHVVGAASCVLFGKRGVAVVSNHMIDPFQLSPKKY